MTERDIVRPHHFDGIQEYDNDLPRWWMALLVLSVVWALLYAFYYHVMGLPLGPDKLAAELAEISELKAKNSTGPLPEELLRELSHNPERIAKGKALFAANQCVTCHGPDSTGFVGPNLRDDWWIYGSDMSLIVETVTLGRLNNAMPAQGKNLSADELINLACFLAERNRSEKSSGKLPDPAREKHTPIGY